MTQADDRLLEILDSEGSLSPKIISDDPRIRFKQNYINQRLLRLTDSGMVERVGRGVYRITDDGRAYLVGDLDARELPEP